jgi:hypothetical protein
MVVSNWYKSLTSGIDNFSWKLGVAGTIMYEEIWLCTGEIANTS